jgi:hypothetical protein
MRASASKIATASQGFNDVEVEIQPAIAPMTPSRSPST